MDDVDVSVVAVLDVDDSKKDASIGVREKDMKIAVESTCCLIRFKINTEN